MVARVNSKRTIIERLAERNLLMRGSCINVAPERLPSPATPIV